jgi:hypothetical protein
MATILYTDFIGKFEQTVNQYTEDKLTAYIERYQTIYLIEMLGKELYDLYVQGLIDEDPIYQFIENDFIEQSSCGEILNSRGIKDMLLGFIYFEYQRDAKTQQTINSAVKMKGENSERAGNYNTNIFGRYNESIDTYKAIQQYCMDNYSDYPTFKGIEKGYSYLTM